MKRRAFLAASVGTAAAFSASTVCGGNGYKAPETVTRTDDTVLDSDGTLAGKSLGELRDQYCYDLFEEYIPFQHKYVVDREYGGYTLHTDWNGPVITHEKTAWYEGRGTWSFSFLYNKLDPDPRHIEAARRSVEFIMKHKPMGDTFWPKSYTREGKAAEAPDNVLYGDIFIANGLCEFSKAEGNERYWVIAREIMLKCMRMYDKPGYGSFVGKQVLGENGPDMPGGARIGGHWFILVKLATDMLEFRSDPDVAEVASRCIDAVHN